MKTKTIKVETPDFCPKDCTEFELEKVVFQSSQGDFIFFRCKNENFCSNTHIRGSEE